MALPVGVGYFVIGKLFTLPTKHVQGWRLTAWIVSAILFGAHIGYECLKRRNSARFVAAHTAAAVSVGALLLAVAGMIHSLQVGPARLKSWILALVLWPVFTAVPAFIAALVISVLLARLRRTDTQ